MKSKYFAFIVMGILAITLFSGCLSSDTDSEEIKEQTEAQIEQELQEELDSELISEDDEVEIGDMF